MTLIDLIIVYNSFEWRLINFYIKFIMGNAGGSGESKENGVPLSDEC